MKNSGPNSDNRIISDGDAGGNENIGGNPDTISYGDRGMGGFKKWVMVVMAGSAEKTFLGDNAVAADGYGRDGIEPSVITDGGVIADGDPPGIMHPDPRTHLDSLPHPGPEEP